MDKNNIIKQPFNNRYTKYIKEALIIDLEKILKKNYKLEKKMVDYYFSKRLL